MGFTSEKTLFAVQKLFDKMFDINSLLDRQVYLLDIKFNLPKYQRYIHEISHKFPLLSDNIQEFGSLRCDLFFRDIVPKHDEDYSSVYDLTMDWAKKLAEVEHLCFVAIKTAIDNNDLMYEDFLRSFEVDKLAKFTKQACVFANAIKDYQETNNMPLWNEQFESYIIPEMVEDD